MKKIKTQGHLLECMFKKIIKKILKEKENEFKLNNLGSINSTNEISSSLVSPLPSVIDIENEYSLPATVYI